MGTLKHHIVPENRSLHRTPRICECLISSFKHLSFKCTKPAIKLLSLFTPTYVYNKMFYFGTCIHKNLDVLKTIAGTIKNVKTAIFLGSR